MPPTIRLPERAEIRRLASQVVVVHELAKEHLGRALEEDDTDVEALQELLDRSVLERDQTYELQCLGVVLGERLVKTVPGLAWCVVEDETGADIALRLRETSELLFPLAMIAKGVEAGGKVDVRAILDGARAKVEGLAGQK
jgi:hypothetical protein